MPKPIRNIGSQTIKWLESIGVNTLEDIEKLGVIETYERLKLAYPEQVSLNALWALQGAILDIPWNEIPESMKEELKHKLKKEKTMELLTLEQFYNHIQGHRRLTLRTIEAFPEDQLFSYSVGGMRPFGEIAKEILEVENSILHGVTSGEWKWEPKYNSVSSKQELVSAFEALGKQTQGNWSKLSADRLQAVEKDAWGMTWANRDRLLYMIDNEIHHRAQGYVYLRSLGIEPPAFYER